MRRTLMWTLLISSALSGGAFAQDAMGPMPMTPPSTAGQAQTEPPKSPMMNMDGMGGMQMTPGQMSMDHEHGGEAHDMSDMTGAYGFYPSARDASGTSWQPDAAPSMGKMTMSGPWMLMGHVTLNGVYDWQDGPRGDEKTFVSGMIMGMARRDLPSGDTLQLRAMLSPDPFMGKRGYPLLLAAGETADGVDHLVDRQHPHDLFMELSASYAKNLTDRDSLFVYAGLPGEPAFGPPAFMHRLSIMDSPEAPISHHWLDSTHITFGVLTAGYVHDKLKIEVSGFNGAEPDERRYNIESPQLDSTAVRLSWNPTENWALQASWADQKSPEQLAPGIDETRWSASAMYTRKVGDAGWWAATLAFGAKDPTGGESRAAWALESAYHPSIAWTFFARAEQIETDELDHHGIVQRVGKASIGAIRDFKLTDSASFGVGALYAKNFVPSALEGHYGGDPAGAMTFVRLKING